MTLAELVIKISCDSSNAVKGIEDTEKKASKLGSLASKVGSGVSAMGKAAATATAVATAAIGKIVISATKAYAQYEQLTGGVETLFKDSSKEVIKYAQEAYKTAGVDANRYMETVTSFSASLLQSMGKDTKEAAKVADMAMRDMSDNAHKMGTDMASIEAAYKGFAKQNYTMLDNLKLGYGGTRKEMQRLLKDASKLTGKKYNINNLKDVYEAIHAIQEELGITGTTAKEAETTIQGSFEMMKASWENLKIAMADPNGDIGAALGNVVESVKIFAGNVIPVVSQTIKGISSAIKELAPVLAEELPTLLSDILPDLVSAAVDLVGGIADAIIQNAPAIIDGFGQIFQKVGEKLESSDNPIAQGFGKLISFVGDMIRDPEGTLTKAWDTIKDVAGKAWEGIKEAASTAWEAIKGWWTTNIAEPVAQAWETTKEAFSTAWDNIKAMASGAWESIKGWWTENISDPVTKAWNQVLRGVGKVWDDISHKASDIWKSIKGWWTENISEPVAEAWKAVQDKATELWNAIKTAASTAWEAIKDAVLNPIRTARSTLAGAWNTIKSAASNAWEAIKAAATSVWNSIKEAILNPIRTARSTISGVWNTIKTTAETAWNNIKSAAETAWNAFKSVVIEPIQAVVDKIKELLGLDETKTINVHTYYHVHTVKDAVKDGLPDPTPEHPYPGLETEVENPELTLGDKLRGNAKGNWDVPYDDYPALLHRNEMVLTASQARDYREGKTPNGGAGGIGDIGSLIVQAIKEGMKDVSVNSYLDGRDVTDVISRIMGNDMTSRRFA